MRRPSPHPLSRAALLLVAALAIAAAARKSAAPIRPDPRLTPGDVLAVTREDLCTPGYAKRVRNVPEAVKRQVFAAYGIPLSQRSHFEVDHLISLELGGSNSIRNLWAESFDTRPWNARVKDKLENRLHALVCARKLDLARAQREIASDWIGAYRKYVGEVKAPRY